MCLTVAIGLHAAEPSAAHLDRAFRAPPEAAKPWVFWYWMNAAVSKEGITADLAAMKASGIEGAYLMSVEGPTQPPLINPPVLQLSPAWWDDVKFAFHEADRLGLKLALHDCDGWATAGGPWITPEHSMQKVVWTEQPIEGGQTLDLALAQPETIQGYYRDIAVFAYPAFNEHRTLENGGRRSVAAAALTERRPSALAENAMSGRADASAQSAIRNPTSEISHAPFVTTDKPGPAPQFLATSQSAEVFESRVPCWIQYAYPEPFTVRAITIFLPPAPNGYQANTYQANRLIVEVSDDGRVFHRVTRLVCPRHGWQDGDAGITHAIPATTARFFRFVYDPSGSEPGAEDLDSAKWKPSLKIRALVLSPQPRIDGFEGKSGAAWRVSPRTTDAQVTAADCVPLARIVDVTRFVGADGHLRWDAPPGPWTILRMGHTSTGMRNEYGGAARGLECDKFDPAVVRSQYDHWFGEAVRQVGPELAHRVLKIFHVDSWECGTQNWSPVFREEFKRRRGYDPLPYLPAMAGVPVESVDGSERFLRDVRTTIAELIRDNFYGTMAALAREQGCAFSAESVAPTMVSDGMLHFAEADTPMGEFWLRSPGNDKLNDVLDAVSGAHIYGRPVAQAEAFTERALSWDEAPWLVKTLQDRDYSFGINRLVYHVFAENPWTDRRPGITLGGVGLFFQRDQTWWRPGRAWVAYASRCQALLQAGRPVADVAVFTGEEIPRRAVVPWQLSHTLPGLISSPESVMAGRKSPSIMEPADWVDPLHGYAYDSINRDALLRLAHVQNGRLVLPGGASYAVLVVPAAMPIDPIADTLSPEVAERLRDFAAAGLTVILGARPVHATSLADAARADATLARVAAELWPSPLTADGAVHSLGRGRIVTGPYTHNTLAPLGIAPDVICSPVAEVGGAGAATDRTSTGFAWTHRAGPDWDIYFLSNQRDTVRDLTVSLRVSGRVPELWDPVTGIQRVAASWRSVDGRTELPLHFAAAGSVFVVFRTATREAGSLQGVNNSEIPVAQTISGPWRVTFDSALGGPNAAVTFDKLGSWTTRPEPEIRNYSGTATYSAHLMWHAPAQRPAHVWLDLGGVHDIAEVAVNGVACGVAWTPPYAIDIASALHDGTNELEIAVTNTWFNRLAGDRDLPADKRVTWTTAPDRTKGKPLLEAGLLGPVALRIE